MRNMSFAMTTPQFLDGSKDVTRRFGWWNVKPGQQLCAVQKGMGLKPGETIKRLGIIEIVTARGEPLNTMTENLDYGFEELRREGYPFGIQWPSQFVERLATHYRVPVTTLVNRIEFKRVA